MSAVGTRVPGTPDVGFSGAEAADTCGALNLRQPPQVTALSVNEEVPHAAHVAQAEGGGPNLGGQHEGLAVLGQTSEIHVPVEVEDLAAFVSGKGDALAVHRDEACRAGSESICTCTMFLLQRIKTGVCGLC